MEKIFHDLFDLEPIEENLFRGKSQEMGLGRVFGGQVLGQALTAANRTVTGRNVHSFHAYFLLIGDDQRPIVYEVDRIRDGRSFATRRVVAIQNGRAIFNMSASFQIPEAGIEHQAAMPETPGPEELPTLLEVIGDMAEPRDVLQHFFEEFPIEIRPALPVNPYAAGTYLPFTSVWLRSRGKLPADPQLHRAILAYASDYGLITTAGLPHGVSSSRGRYREASLDHALWFHREFRIDDWLLYVTESPSASGARGFTRGNLFTRDGKLVASVAQEGLIRERPSSD